MTALIRQLLKVQRAGLSAGPHPLAERRIAIAGLGALGSLLAENVVRLGFGEVVLIDRDIVERSNLHRQVLYDEESIGHPKVEAAERRLKSLGSRSRITAVAEHLSRENASQLLDGCDMVLCAVDNTTGRLAINDHALRHEIRWIYGGAIGYRGEAMLLAPPDGPCYGCLFPSPVKAPIVDAYHCGRDGILLPSVMAVAGYCTFLALVEDAREQAGRRYMFSGATLKMSSIAYPRNPGCVVCKRGVYISSGEETNERCVSLLCGNAAQFVPKDNLRLDLEEIARRIVPQQNRLTEWYLQFSDKSHRVTLWRNGRMMVTNTSSIEYVVNLFRRLTASTPVKREEPGE